MVELPLFVDFLLCFPASYSTKISNSPIPSIDISRKSFLSSPLEEYSSLSPKPAPAVSIRKVQTQKQKIDSVTMSMVMNIASRAFSAAVHSFAAAAKEARRVCNLRCFNVNNCEMRDLGVDVQMPFLIFCGGC
jgi:hypothetical protein